MSTIPPDSELLMENMALLNSSGFSQSELLAIRMLLKKMKAGSLKHGPLDLTSDGRNWREEKLGELADFVWYGVFEEVQALIGGGNRG